MRLCVWVGGCVHRCKHWTLSPLTSVISSPPDTSIPKNGTPRIPLTRGNVSGSSHLAPAPETRPPQKCRAPNVFFSIMSSWLTGPVPVLGHARSDQATFKVQCGRLAGLRGLWKAPCCYGGRPKTKRVESDMYAFYLLCSALEVTFSKLDYSGFLHNLI